MTQTEQYRLNCALRAWRFQMQLRYKLDVDVYSLLVQAHLETVYGPSGEFSD